MLLLVQGISTFILLSRLIKGATRSAPLEYVEFESDMLAKVSVIIPTLNERDRIEPCLIGLGKQGNEVREVLFIDSHSQDGTIELINEYIQKDPRFHLLHDQPLPPDWVGRPWALHSGFLETDTESKWILGIDADTMPQKGLIASMLKTAELEKYDLLSLAPRFILEEPGEWLLQPALLVTLLYRCNLAGVSSYNYPSEAMANGQCFLCKRQILEDLGGYQIAAGSFCDDVTLARYAASKGYKVGFLDGSSLLHVRMYNGFKDTWSGWGRSIDLKDATSTVELWANTFLLILVQALPLSLLLFSTLAIFSGYSFLSLKLLWLLNLFLVLVRFALLLPIYSSYLHKSKPSELLFWLSPLLDPLAVLRIVLSATSKPKQWRGRVY